MHHEDLAFTTAERFAIAGRRVVISGAAQGIGLGIASAFVGAGASVALLDIDGPALDEAVSTLATRGTAVGREVDVRDLDAVTAAVDSAAAELGGLDTVINNSAIFTTVLASQMEPEQFIGLLDINVVGYARLYRAAYPHLVSNGSGAVVNIASHGFHLGGPPMMSAYVASKGAVIGFTRTVAAEAGPLGITVNSIAPGSVPTRAEREIDPAVIGSPEEFRAAILSQQSIKRRGSTSDIAAAVMFLATDAATFINGQTLLVDGGTVNL